VALGVLCAFVAIALYRHYQHLRKKQYLFPMKSLLWFLFIFFAVIIGLYPVAYGLFDMSQGFLSAKPPELLQDQIWNAAFYLHIFPGGIALFIGWSQFVKRFRDNYLRLHRTIGTIYMLCILISGLSGLYIAMFATGGIISVVGFSGLAVSWLFTTLMAYISIRRLNITAHEQWMIRSYALCFAAVTLRVWLPLFQFGFGIDFFTAYPIIAWLCWVPNLIVAEMMCRLTYRETRLDF
jgi:uncharacterized membrane protein